MFEKKQNFLHNLKLWPYKDTYFNVGKKLLLSKINKVRHEVREVTEWGLQESTGSERLQKAGKRVGQCQSD